MTERRYQPERIGRGLEHGLCKRIVVSFDDETFDLIRDRAMRQGTSFAAQVRDLVEWGLDADKGEAPQNKT